MEFVVPNVEDYKKINDLAVQVHNFHVNWRPDFFVKCDDIIDKADLEEMIQNNSIFVLKENSEILAYVAIMIKEKIHKGFRYRKQLDINAICVDEKYRNQGIGTKLLNYVKDYALENGCTDITLSVNEENLNAIHLYDKFGMKRKHIVYSMQIV